MTHTNTCIMGAPKGEDGEQGVENLVEKIMTKNSPNLVKEKDTQVQEVQRVPHKMNPKRSTPRRILIKMSKVKDKKSLKNIKRKAGSYLQGSSHKTSC